jgi:hypothetical protein
MPVDPGVSSSSCVFLLFPTVGAILPIVASTLTFPAYFVCSTLFCFGGIRPLHIVQSLTFRNPLEIRALLSRCPALGFPWGSCWIPFCFVAAVSGFGPLCYCCLPGPSNVSSSPFDLSGFLSRHCPCFFSHASVSRTLPLLQSGSSYCRRRPTSSAPTITLGPFLRLTAAPCR